MGSYLVTAKHVAPTGKEVTTMDRYLTNVEVAHLIKVHPRTVNRWAKEGVLPAVLIAGSTRHRTIRFSEKAILEWMAERPPLASA
jgi:excisionase family DNA binding protein